MELSREDVNIYVKVSNSDSEHELSQRADMSKDCNVNTINNVVSVFVDLSKKLTQLSFSDHQKSLYSEYYERGDLQKYEVSLSEQKGSVAKFFYGNRKAYIILKDTYGLEKNATPILFVCQGYRGCTTSYIHPSGIKISYASGDYRNFEKSINRVVTEQHKVVELLFLKTVPE